MRQKSLENYSSDYFMAVMDKLRPAILSEWFAKNINLEGEKIKFFQYLR